ncbi:hypothetical protein ALC57_01847 [Trachymyrmex cornetzi]|uniref:Uncharacterized protein n=1 Tax=Trachymyrmex cornetzi TaxID=471704 RepID=A0A195EKX1_9HYME|nr:hypothetical protein ALC57_01847 [Trachymyrmex cornetzi]
MFEVADKAGGFGAGATLCRVYNGNCLAEAIPNKKRDEGILMSYIFDNSNRIVIL